MNDEEDRNYSMNLLKISIGALDQTIHYLNEIVSIQENGDLPITAVEINQEIRTTMQILHSQITESNAAIYTRVPEGTQLMTNPAYFESIILNLLTNAIKYRAADRPPEINIALSDEAGYKVLSVKDNGIGLDLNKIKDQLFKIFNTFNNNKEANGVGLYITKT